MVEQSTEQHADETIVNIFTKEIIFHNDISSKSFEEIAFEIYIQQNRTGLKESDGEIMLKRL